jgi:actin related protein 2/3 complex, subunit 1A/1B
MFKQMDLKGKTKDDSKLDTVHQNTITTIRVYEGSPGSVRKFSSKSHNTKTVVTELIVSSERR